MTTSGCQPQYEPDVNSITQAHVDALAHHVQQLGQAVAAQGRKHRQHRAGFWKARLHLVYLKAATALRRVAISLLGWRWAGMLIVASILGGAVFVASLSWKVACGAFALGMVGSACMLYLPSATKISERLSQRQRELATLTNQYDQAAHCLDGLRRDFSVASERLERWRQMLTQRQYRESAQYRRHQLLRRDWKALRSVPFETFLEEVFRELGYLVETTKVTGDQGADLIVSTSGHRIAIQVKGYFNSVSNSAVQEAYTAKEYYKCEACAVVTNSRFTASAKDVANRVGCILIDEDNLPALIIGNIDLWQLHLAQRPQPQVDSQEWN